SLVSRPAKKSSFEELMNKEQSLSPRLFDFLRELKDNNNRPWFEANKERYKFEVRDPVLDFISAFAQPLSKISPHFVADPRANGGSLFRIYRDVRFSKDKTPYKTNVGAHFRHSAGKDAHAPGFYLHFEPAMCFAGCGIWRPDNQTLGKIRKAIIDRPEEWTDVVSNKNFRSTFKMSGESLKRPPKGFDPEHPLIEDLKRKDFVAVTSFPQEDACRPDFIDRFSGIARSGSEFVKFLSKAVGVPF
ncbi:MAG: DUF2461 domain-containing protein, partial [Albidovulum sp.]|nr:DUF2461 domain-containing protein [Albidovulum sp.]